MKCDSLCARLLVLLGLALSAGISQAADAPIRILFLGDNGHHRPADRFRELQPVLAKRGIQMIYTDRVEDLNPEKLNEFQGLAIYANQERISPEQEKALLDYVEQGHGFIPLHCASYCFLNSPKYVALVGAQFARHETGVFRVEQVTKHPVLDGFQSFESWDETYVHKDHNGEGRTVLEVRRQDGRRSRRGRPEEDSGEPWTWVRTQGQGRVFYTAWGHDARTWTNAGFQNLVERGIRWAVGGDPSKAGPYQDRPEMTPLDPSAKPTEFVEAKLPFYPAGERWGTIGEPITKMQKPLDAAESLKHISVPVGFKPELVATEPEIGKPLAMNWDERGRLWLTETYDYPNELQPEGKGRDKIRICEDTDGDGRMDKFTVFAEHLSIPTSLTFAYGGVIVHQAPDTLFLRDNDGDDVADQRDVLFTGWRTNDTHAGPSNLCFGLDGWYYGMVGYAGFQGKIAGETQRFQTGFYRFKLAAPKDAKSPPAVAAFEFLRNTNNNSWGVGISEDGLVFGSTANGNPSEYMPVANRYYERVRGWSSSVLDGIALDYFFDPITEDVRQVDHHGGFTAAAGHALYTARNYPPEYWNRTAFVAEPTGHLIATFTIQPDGAGFISRNSWNLLASNDEWAAPIAAEVGPDGNVWFIDWYNIIVQHNPTPVGYETGKGAAYVSEFRDKTHGRVYRIEFTGQSDSSPEKRGIDAARVKPVNLSKVSPDELVAALNHTNFFWRRHAQRLLIERGRDDVAAALQKLIADSKPDAGEELVPAAAHALWTLANLGDQHAAKPAASAAALRHSSAGVRRNAVATLPATEASLTAIQQSQLIADPDGQVRLATLLKIADCPSSDVGAELVAQALVDPAVQDDRWLLDAVTSAAAVHSVPLVKRLAGADQKSLLAPQVLERLAIVGEHLGRGGDGAALSTALSSLTKAQPPIASALVQGLSKGWPKDKTAALTPDADKALVELFEKSEPSTKTVLLTMASKVGSKSLEAHAAELTELMLTQVKDETTGDEKRIAAAKQLIELRRNDPEAVSALLEEIGPRTPPALGEGLLDAIGGTTSSEAYSALAERLKSFTPNLRNAAVRIMIARVDGATAYLDAVEKGQAQFNDLALDQKQALASHPEKSIASRAKTMLERGGGLPNPDRQKVIDEYMPITKLTGDAAAGKELFKKQCMKCHMHSGEGTRIGPDLTGMAVHPKAELLVHILDPSRSVEGNFRSYTVATTEGTVLTGLLASETKTSIELFDAEGKKQILQREDIEQFVASPKSLMPEGFEKQITKDDLTNILEFLTQRGKFFPLPIDKVATAISTKGLFYNENDPGEGMIFADWTPKTFDGIPFYLIDPQGQRARNIIMLYGGPPNALSQKLPKTATVPCNSPAKAIHLLSGVSGWGSPFSTEKSVTMIVRLHYADATTEDHELKNGEEFADYIRRVDVPGSKFAFNLRGHQIRYLSVQPSKPELIKEIEFVKGPDMTAPIIMAVTVETK